MGVELGIGPLALLAWLATYALHSTLILGGAWLVTRRMPLAATRLKERVWKLGLLLALCTPSLQLGLGLEPFGGRFSLARSTQQVATLRAPVTPPTAARELVAHTASARPSGTAGVVDEALPARERLPLALGGLGLVLWLACGALALFGLALAWLRLAARLRGRELIEGGPLFELVHDLARRAGYRRRVRLSVAPALRVPISLGWMRPEICLPPRALVELDVEEQEALLAHELAHLARRDPAWLWFMRLVSGVLCFQPLNRLARREIEDCAEILCDAWAVSHTGLRLSLASCLARVAGWVVAEPKALPAPAMALKSSRLRVRVESLLEEGHAERLSRATRAHALCLPLAVVCAAALVLVAPAVSSQAREEPAVYDADAPLLATEVPTQEPGTLDALRELIGLLDSELEALDREFAAFQAEIARDDPLDLLRDSIAPLEEKLELLRARRARLASIVGGSKAEEAALALPIPRTLENLR
jgi:beta-lactamase regulating signal transducer with metallopeptidase domain